MVPVNSPLTRQTSTVSPLAVRILEPNHIHDVPCGDPGRVSPVHLKPQQQPQRADCHSDDHCRRAHLEKGAVGDAITSPFGDPGCH